LFQFVLSFCVIQSAKLFKVKGSLLPPERVNRLTAVSFSTSNTDPNASFVVSLRSFSYSFASFCALTPFCFRRFDAYPLILRDLAQSNPQSTGGVYE
jgi:hypothetical protein